MTELSKISKAAMLILNDHNAMNVLGAEAHKFRIEVQEGAHSELSSSEHSFSMIAAGLVALSKGSK